MYTVQHRYDLAGRRIVLKHPSNVAPARDSVIFSYLGWGPLSQVTGMEGETYSYSYDDAQRIAKVAFPGSVKDTSRFDAEGRVVRRQVIRPSETLIDDTLTYNRQGKILTGTMSGTAAGGGGSVTNWYDGFGAAIASHWENVLNAGFQTDEYAYDAHGNQGWAHKKDAGTMNDTLTYTYAASGRLETIEPVNGVSSASKPFTYRDYDNSGNVTFGAEVQKSMSSSSYVTSRSYYGTDEKLRLYRKMSNLPSGSASDVVDEYRYDALGRRVLMRSNHASNCGIGLAECFSAIARFVWDGDQLLWELRNSGTSESAVGSRPYGGKIAYVHGTGIDKPLGVLMGGDSLLVPHVNWRGSYIVGTYANGAKASGFSWMGATVRMSFEGGALDGDWWGSLVKDQLDATGMLYRRNRSYDPKTGQFSQQDPIGLAGGLNLYGFAGGDPLNLTDPFGLNCIDKDRKPVPCPPGEDAALRQDEKGVERPAIDPVAIAADVLTGGVSLVGRVTAKAIGGAVAKRLTRWGWQGAAKHRAAVRQLTSGGTHEAVGGIVPTVDEARGLIERGGGTILRIEEHLPGGVSHHTYPHINYTTKGGSKATVRVQSLDP